MFNPPETLTVSEYAWTRTQLKNKLDKAAAAYFGTQFHKLVELKVGTEDVRAWDNEPKRTQYYGTAEYEATS